MNIVVADSVVSALENKDRHGVEPQASNSGYLVVGDNIPPVNIFGTGTVTAKQDSGMPQVVQPVALNTVIPAVQIKAYAAIGTVEENTVTDHTVFRAAQSHKGIALIVHFPVVLNTAAVLA